MNHTEPQSQNPYVFIVGCPRSGTTLLQRMVDAHPSLAIANDTHFIPRILHKNKLEDNPPMTPELMDAVRTYKRFPRLELSDAAIDRAYSSSNCYIKLVSALYDEYGQARNKLLAGEKTPDYVRNLPLLNRLFPWAKFIHIVRDGRNVALSALDWATPTKGPGRIELWNEEPMAVCALWWRRNVICGRSDGSTLGESFYHEVRYEDLVSMPVDELSRICEFLTLPFSPKMLAFHQGKRRDSKGLSAKSAWLPVTAGLRDWRSTMNERDLELFEAIAGDLLTELGYERAFTTISSEITTIADQCETWWRERKWHRESTSREPTDSPQ